MTRRHWTEDDTAVLLAAYPDTPTQAIAESLGRPVKSVYQKATALGLKKNKGVHWVAAAAAPRPASSPDADQRRRATTGLSAACGFRGTATWSARSATTATPTPCTAWEDPNALGNRRAAFGASELTDGLAGNG